MSQERVGAVTLKGNPTTLIGPELKAGDRAPDFTANKSLVETVSLADTAGKVRILLSVPSLDTGLCAQETKRFNEEAKNLPDGVAIQVVSMDLPFAQARFCGAEGVENVQTLSDWRTAAFGEAYGVLIKDLRLLARAAFVVDRNGTLRHVEYVPEVTTEPDYDAVLNAARTALG